MSHPLLASRASHVHTNVYWPSYSLNLGMARDDAITLDSGTQFENNKSNTSIPHLSRAEGIFRLLQYSYTTSSGTTTPQWCLLLSACDVCASLSPTGHLLTLVRELVGRW